MNNHINSRVELIKKIPLFENISSENIEDILALSSIFNLKKNKLLFYKNEEVKYFYIILKGSAILFENSSNGNQNVLQLLKKGEIIGDAFAKNFIFSASSNEDSMVMLIPIKLIRDLIKNNQTFCLNLLKELSSKNKKILHLLSRIKINNSKQRVAQFIHSLRTENDKNLTEIDFNYNKSIIASYLNIEPETFSRALKKFKIEEEIEVYKNSIKFLKENSLVKYLNKEG